MTAEEPDAPMPLCFSPENYRAEVSRRKSAERERDDLAKQAERLIETSEQLRANVATLVEQLDDAREDERRICVEHDERLSEVALLRSLLADTAKALGKDGALLVAVPCIAREVVEQLGEAERRNGELQARLPDAEKLDVIRRHLEDNPRTNARQILDIFFAGAAQPVAEPRDETKPPPGWKWFLHGDVVSHVYACRVDGFAAGVPLAHAWAKYDAEHGYAPHPSGTEGPRPGVLVDLLRAAYGRIQAFDKCVVDGVKLTPYSETVKRGRDMLRDIDKYLAQRPAASPPDYAPHPSGTEGPPAEMRDKALRFDLDQAGIESRERDAVMFVETRALLARIVKYAREDRAETPRFTRLARALAEAERLLAASPPDGTASERARVDDVLAAARRMFYRHDGIDDICKYIGDLLEISGGPLDATRPPDGMPGEPATGIDPKYKRVEVAWIRIDGQWLPTVVLDGIPVQVTVNERVGLGPLAERWGPRIARPDELPAAPPTVPGEPPARENRHVDHWAHIECVLNGPAIEFSDRAIEQARGARCRHGYRWRDESPAAPPTPPLTPERAPLDEAAVRADERMKCVAAIRDVQSKLILPDAREFCDLIISRIDIIGHENEPASGPRRSEGAG